MGLSPFSLGGFWQKHTCAQSRPLQSQPGLYYLVTTVILSARSCFALSGFCGECNTAVAPTTIMLPLIGSAPYVF